MSIAVDGRDYLYRQTDAYGRDADRLASGRVKNASLGVGAHVYRFETVPAGSSLRFRLYVDRVHVFEIDDLHPLPTGASMFGVVSLADPAPFSAVFTDAMLETANA
jgi:hypothetical protein